MRFWRIALRSGAHRLAVQPRSQTGQRLSAYSDPEVVWRVPRANHAGLLIASPDAERVAALLAQYTERFARDFLAHAPQTKQARTTL